MDKGNFKIISIILMICLFCCFLTGCPSPADESKEAEEHVKQVLPMAEEALKQAYPNAILDKKSFHGISGIKMGPDHGVTDWVEGQYKNGGVKDILINVKTREIYTTEDEIKVSMYAMKRAHELYNTDAGNMEGSVGFDFEAPYCSDGKYGDFQILNMLPIDSVVDDKFIDELLDGSKYHKTYYLLVDEDFDMSIFEETDHSPLGNNVRVYVEQYDKEYLKGMNAPGFTPEAGTDEPRAVFDSDKDN